MPRIRFAGLKCGQGAFRYPGTLGHVIQRQFEHRPRRTDLWKGYRHSGLDIIFSSYLQIVLALRQKQEYITRITNFGALK